jgi:hypothetical protein
MNKDLLIKITFGISVIGMILWGIVKIMHFQFPIPFVYSIVWISTLIYTVLALLEIFSSDRVRTSEKVMWVIGFLVINTIAGILYFVLKRNSLTRHYKVLSTRPF